MLFLAASAFALCLPSLQSSVYAFSLAFAASACSFSRKVSLAASVSNRIRSVSLATSASAFAASSPFWSLKWTRRVQLRSSSTVNGKDVRLTTGVSLWTRLSAIFFRTVTHNSQLSDLTIRLHKTTSLKSVSQKRWLYHQMFKCFFWLVQFSQSISFVRNPVTYIGICRMSKNTEHI